MRLNDILNIKPWVLAHTTTVQDVYGTDNPEAPEGYEFTGEFRPPKLDEIALSIHGPLIVEVTSSFVGAPRLILKKAGPTVESVYGTPHPKIPAGYEPTGDFRPIKSGDVYMKRDGGIATGTFHEPTNAPRLILRRIPRKRVIFEATGECRLPKKGEWIPDREGFRTVHLDYTYDTLDIYIRREEEF